MSEKLPLPSHVSEATRRLNPHLYTQGATTPIIKRQGPELRDTAYRPLAKPKQTHRKLDQKGRQPNKTEHRFGLLLEARQKRGEIDSYRYEGVSLRWGKGMRYTPDYMVFCGLKITVLEVKGPKIHDKDLIRFKGCKAEWDEISFEMWQEIDREWKRIL